MKLLFKLLAPIFMAALFLYNSSELKASHVAGADWSYQCIGQDSFLVTLNVFRDCSGISLGTTQTGTFYSPCGTYTVSMTVDTIIEVSQLCPSAINSSTCNGGSLPGMQQYIFSEVVYLPPCASGPYQFMWQNSARNGATNFPASNFVINAELNNTDAPCNNSPEFNAQPIPYVCANQQVVYNFGVTEVDGDSLVFSLGQPYTSFSSGVFGAGTFSGSYSYTNPFNVPVSLNSVTGELTFTPTTNGLWLIKVCVDEYRNGVHIGQVCRDIQFVVSSCANNQPYMINPGITNFQGTGIQVDSNSIEVCYGDSISFDIYFSDSLYTQSSPAQTYGDSVTLSSNIVNQLPGAIVTYINGDTAMAHVEWVVPSSGVNSFYVFVMNAVDDACNIPGMTSNAFDITVTEWTYAGPDQSLCSGEDTANFSAIGGSQFEWTVIPNPDGSAGDPIVTSGPNQNFSDTTGTAAQNVWAFPAFTTTYQLTSNLSGTCKNIDTVTVYVVRNFTLSTYGDTAVCPNDSLYNFQIGAVPDTSASAGTDPFNFSYQWSNGSYLNYDTVSDPLVNTSTSLNFNVTVSSDSGCVKTDNVRIDFAPDFPLNIAVDYLDTLLCLGDSTVASVNFGFEVDENCGLSTTPCEGPSYTGVIGTATNTNSQYTNPNPYRNYYYTGARQQILYRAAELQAMGMTNGGKISSIAFNVAATNGTATLQNYTIKMTCISANSVTSTWNNSGVTVFGPTNYTATNGWNVHSFATPYNWDGVSNLLVEICYNGVSGSIYANSAYYTTTGFASVRYLVQSDANICSTSISGSVSSNRPNTQFGFCTGFDPAAFSYNWSPNTDISSTTTFDPYVYPTSNATYYVTLTDTFGACWDTASALLEVVTSYDASFTLDNPMCINGGVDSAVAVTQGGTWSGSGIVDPVNGLFDPFSAGVGTHTVDYTVSSPAGNCTTVDSFTVQVIPQPDAGYSGPTLFCKTGGPYTLTPNTPGGVWSGNGITDSINGIFDPSSLIIGQAYVYYTLEVPCHNTDTFILDLYNEVSFDFDQDPITICQNDTLVLYNNYTISTAGAFDSLTTIATWSGNNITDPDSGYYTPTYAGADSVFLTVTDSNGLCASTERLNITVNAVDTPSVIDDLGFCDNITSAYINVDKGWNASYVTWSFTPITGSGNIAPNNGTFNPSSVGEGSWEMQYSYTNLNGCTGSLVDTIQVFRTPVEPELSSNIFCVGEDVILRASGAAPDTVYWYSNSNADTASYIGMGNPYFWNVASDDDVDNPKTVYARAENEYCYSDIVSYEIPVVPAPDVTIKRSYVDSNGASVSTYDEGEVIYGDAPFTIDFTAEGANVPPDSVYWDFWNNGSSEDGPYGWPAISSVGDVPFSPYTYEKEGVYSVLLITTNEYGCADTSYAQHEVNFEAEPPNVFTPNGDGINDIFYIPGALALRDFNCVIFNRWGRKVYEWSDPKAGWDGSGSNDGVYYYIVTGKRADDSDYTRQGTVTLTTGS